MLNPKERLRLAFPDCSFDGFFELSLMRLFNLSKSGVGVFAVSNKCYFAEPVSILIMKGKIGELAHFNILLNLKMNVFLGLQKCLDLIFAVPPIEVANFFP